MPAPARSVGSSPSSCTPTSLAVYVCLAALGVQVIMQQNVLTQLRSELEEMKDIHSMALRKITKLSVDNESQQLNSVSAIRQQIPALLESTFMQQPEFEIPNYLKMQSPPNMPSVRLTEEEEKKAANKRKIYGGVGDKLHLGGFTIRDDMGISENLWNWMMGPLAVKSMIDVGCGKGVSTEYFYRHGARVMCVEGSHDAVTQSLLPLDKVVEHDFSRGPWWPDDTFDVAWSVEFLEHVGRPYMYNYLPTLHKAALLFVTSSAWGGWHHVEVHEEWWWRNRLEAQGFKYAIDLTQIARQQADNDAKSETDAQHLRHRLLVFINPKVAALPKHHHLFGGHGCFGNIIDNRDGGVPCTDPGDILPERYQSLMNCSRFVDVSKIKTKEEKGSAWQRALWKCKSRAEASSSLKSSTESESDTVDTQEQKDAIDNDGDVNFISRPGIDRGGTGGRGRGRKRKKMINSV